ncbi:MAG: sigma-70 family RNA polymerase sigma factor [Candidatus Acidiferrales bacterium]|jgi:RNA polymerase sigma-70 factor (ECF subfamily)
MMSTLALAREGWMEPDADVAQLRRGDPSALEPLLARYQNRLYRYLLRLVREPNEAEDLFQQTWVRVVEKIEKYDPRRNFDAWLFTLARNLAIDHLRRVRPQSLDEPLPSGTPMGDTLPSAAQPPFERALQRERASRVARAMEAMSFVHREVLALRFEEEMKLEEIASVLDCPLSTVKSRLCRGLESLRSELETRYPGGVWQ